MESSHRSRKVVSTSNTAGPSMATCTSCQAGRGPNACGIGITWAVALVVDVVAAAVAQVDAAEVRDVARRVVAVPQHDELLVVRAAGAHPHVAQALAAGLVDLDAEQPRLLGVEAELVPVRAPQQPAHVGPAPGRRGERRRHRRCRVVGQPLVRVAPPVDEVEQVALAQGADPLVQLGHVRPAVHDGPHPVPLAPRDALRVVVVDDGVGVVPLGGREEEIGEHAAILPVRGPPARTVVGRSARRPRGRTLLPCRHAGDASGARGGQRAPPSGPRRAAHRAPRGRRGHRGR